MSDGVAVEDEKLIEKWIEPDPWKSGAEEARIKNYGMNVWAIIGCLGGDAGDIAEVARGYDVPVEVIHAAVAYYRRHKRCIDARLRANRGGDAVMGDDPLIARYIDLDPDWQSAAEARIKGYGMHVWAIIEHLGGEDGDIAGAARAYDVPVEVVEAALAYYRLNRDTIDCWLAATRA